jgi:hypothetical protein
MECCFHRPVMEMADPAQNMMRVFGSGSGSDSDSGSD